MHVSSVRDMLKCRHLASPRILEKTCLILAFARSCSKEDLLWRQFGKSLKHNLSEIAMLIPVSRLVVTVTRPVDGLINSKE